MTHHTDLSIRQRMGAGFGLLLLVFVALLGAVLYWQTANEREQSYYSDLVRPRAEATERLERAILYVAVEARRLALDPSPEAREQFQSRISYLRSAGGDFESLEKDEEGEALEASVVAGVEEFTNQAGVLAQKLNDPAAGVEPSDHALLAAREAALARLEEYAHLQRRHAAEAMDTMADTRRTATHGVGIAGLLSVVLLLGFGHVMTESIRRPVFDLVRISRALEKGDWSLALERAPESGPAPAPEPRNELSLLERGFARAARALNQREERLRADGAVAAAIASNLELQRVAGNALDAIVRFTDAAVGVVYALDASRGVLRPVAAHAVESRAKEVPIGLGVPGQAAAERRPVVLREIPAGTDFEVSIGYDKAPPRAVAAVPILFQGEVQGVVLIASLRDIDEDAMTFLDRASVQLGVGLRNARAYEEIQDLLEHLRERNEQVQAQNEEIQTQNEEIQAQNEEIQAQNEEIRAQSEELQSRNEEVRRSNEDLKRHAVEVERAAGELRLVDERKNEFLGVLAHELRNPMAPISNSLFILDNTEPGSPKSNQALAVLNRQARHLARLIDDLLDVTRISSAKIQIDMTRLELCELVRACIEDQQPALTAKSLKLRVEADEPLWVDADGTRMHQVVGNLLNNAVKFTPKGEEIHLGLRAEESDEGRHAVLRIRDNGSGISPDLLPRIFEPFQQGTSTLDRSSGGLGLGLALVKGLVELHGGTIEANSEGAGKGAEFVVRLPMKADSSRKKTEPEKGAPSREEPSARVLVIEDNVDSAMSLKEVIELLGHEADVAFNSADGIEKAKKNLPDVILCDIGLPTKSGYEVARELRADAALQETRLVALTGYAAPADKKKALECGFDHHLAKPPKMATLQSVLSKANGKVTLRQSS